MPAKLQVQAGTSYDPDSLVDINVNDDTKLTELESDLMTAKVAVRIRDYRGMCGVWVY